jgi:hypothetical protein
LIEQSITRQLDGTFEKNFDPAGLICTMMLPLESLATNDKWTVALCSQKLSGGPLYKFGKSKAIEEMELPKQALAMIPISDVFDRVGSKLSELLGETKYHGAKGVP